MAMMDVGMELNKNHVSFEMDIFTRKFLRITRRVQVQGRHSLIHNTVIPPAIFHPTTQLSSTVCQNSGSGTNVFSWTWDRFCDILHTIAFSYVF